MTLQAWLVVFSTTADNPQKVLPEEEEIREAIKDQLDIPDEENTVVDLWPVDIEAMGYEEKKCRRCNEDIADDRLFCNGCADAIAGTTG